MRSFLKGEKPSGIKAVGYDVPPGANTKSIQGKIDTGGALTLNLFVNMSKKSVCNIIFFFRNYIYYIECQRRFLDNKITPVVSKLIKKVASYQPNEVIEFICEELFSMYSGKNVDLGNVLINYP